jgi:hypothetical protein
VSNRFIRSITGSALMVLAAALIIPTAAHAATVSAAASTPSQVRVVPSPSAANVNVHSTIVSVKVTSIPAGAVVVQSGGQILLSVRGTVVARVVSPGYASAQADLAQRPGTASLLLSGRATATNAAQAASPALRVGYGCLVQPWPGTHVHPCGYVISNPVAQGIFNALKVLGSAVAVAVCTGALVALGDNPGQAASICGTAVAILAGFVSLGSKCLFIVNTPSWLAGQILAVNC